MSRICLVSDIHHGANSLTKMGTEAGRLMEEFVTFANQGTPDLVIDLGDRISDVDHSTDLRLEREAAAFFSPLTMPVIHINGNHDRDNLSVDENASILGQSLENEIIDFDDWQLVIWRADSKIHRPGGFILPEEDLIWLAGVIASADKPLAIFTHVPLSGHDQTTNYYFANNAQLSQYAGATSRIMNMLQTATVPVATFAGHVHWNTLTVIHGQPHFTLQSLTESFTTNPQPAGAFATLELGAEIIWEVHGLDRFYVKLPTDQTRRRWMTPLASL